MVAFKSNKGNFDHQPIFTLTNNPGLTGDDFISYIELGDQHCQVKA